MNAWAMDKNFFKVEQNRRATFKDHFERAKAVVPPPAVDKVGLSVSKDWGFNMNVTRLIHVESAAKE